MLRRNTVFRLVAMSFVPLVGIVLVAGCPMTPVAECVADADCAEGQVCENGVCTTAPAPECVADADCADGQVCDDGVCVASEEPAHKTLFINNLGDANYYGTQTCLTCHANHAANIMEGAHWNWSGVVDDIAGLEGETHGKVDLINDY
jgi:Cys-rich repeat protein